MPQPLLRSGLHPKASDALRGVPVPAGRITQVIGTAADSAGYHLAEPGNDAPGRYWIINGQRFCAATDLSVRNPSLLSESDIINLLERLARAGFAAWYRKPGFDGWPARNRQGRRTSPHIHIVYAGIPMKAVLRDQVEQFLRGRNGLRNGPYNFHRFGDETVNIVRALYEASDRGRISTARIQDADVTALALDAGFDNTPQYFSFELGGAGESEAPVIEVEDLSADEEFECGCGCEEEEISAAELSSRYEPAPSEHDQDWTPNVTDDYAVAGEEEDAEGDESDEESIEALAVRPWRAAKSLLKLRDQVNQQAPGRSKASDGTVGDASHQSRDSDHNPWIIDGAYGVVSALDITHDPAHGCNVDVLAANIIQSRDGRIKYIIRSRKILRSYPKNGRPAWTWQSYGGDNPHDKHIHFSVKSDKANYDSEKAWAI